MEGIVDHGTPVTSLACDPISADVGSHGSRRHGFGSCSMTALTRASHAAALQKGTRLVERQPREARVQRAWVAISDVAEKVRLHVAFREELLVATETRLAGGEKRLVNLRGIEAGHWAAVKAKRARSHNQIRALQTRIPLRSRLDVVRTRFKQLDHPGVVRKELRQ